MGQRSAEQFALSLAEPADRGGADFHADHFVGERYGFQMQVDELHELPRVGRGLDEADSQWCGLAAGVAEDAQEQHRALVAGFEMFGQLVDELREDVQECDAIGGRLVERAVRFEGREAAMGDDDFGGGAGELIKPAQELVAETRGEALARQGEELGDGFDAELAEEEDGVGRRCGGLRSGVHGG